MLLFCGTEKIGIFDSGMGGLTVAHAIAQHLPQENLLYFGDTMHTPWGDKSQATIQGYVSRIVDFLLSQQCKVIVVACNTASAVVYESIQAQVRDRALLLNVIDPVVSHIQTHYPQSTIGLIATKQTVRSEAYKKRIAQASPQTTLHSLATPLLVPLIEEGYLDTPVCHQVLADYLGQHQLSAIEALILGCTHYPLLKKQLEQLYQDKVEIIDSAALTAQFLKKVLTQQDLLNTDPKPQHRFYVSDNNPFFSNLATVFFGENIRVEQIELHVS